MDLPVCFMSAPVCCFMTSSVREMVFAHLLKLLKCIFFSVIKWYFECPVQILKDIIVYFRHWFLGNSSFFSFIYLTIWLVLLFHKHLIFHWIWSMSSFFLWWKWIVFLKACIPCKEVTWMYTFFHICKCLDEKVSFLSNSWMHTRVLLIFFPFFQKPVFSECHKEHEN